MDVLNQSWQNLLSVQFDIREYRKQHDKEMFTYYTNSIQKFTSQSKEAAARVSKLEERLCQLQNEFCCEETKEKQIQAETVELSIKLNEACVALIPLQYQLRDHQFELRFQSESKRILSEMISNSDPPPEDETLTRLHSIMANLDTKILNEEEEIKNFSALINQKNDEVSQVRKKLADAAGLLNKKHNDMAKIQKDIDDTNSQIRRNQLVVRVDEEMATTLELWFKESLCCRIRE